MAASAPSGLARAAKAVVFDMDGVIVDSELQWQLASFDFFKRRVPLWRDEDNHRIVGLGVEDLYHFLVREYSLSAGKHEFLKECHDLAQLVYTERCTLAQGFRELVAALRVRGLKVGLASSSPRAWIDFVLGRFGLTFDALACADDVPSGKTKPEPDIYRLCLARLGIEPAEAVAVEDSRFGVTAAKAAGLRCVALRNGANDAQDLSLADAEARGYSELSRALLG